MLIEGVGAFYVFDNLSLIFCNDSLVNPICCIADLTCSITCCFLCIGIVSFILRSALLYQNTSLLLIPSNLLMSFILISENCYYPDNYPLLNYFTLVFFNCNLDSLLLIFLLLRYLSAISLYYSIPLIIDCLVTSSNYYINLLPNKFRGSLISASLSV